MNGLMGLAVLLLSGCAAPASEAELIAGIQARMAAQETEALFRQACHERSMQSMEEFRGCMKLPFQSPEQIACYDAHRARNLSRAALVCRSYDERVAHRLRAYRKAGDVCLAMYPGASPANMKAFSACMTAQGW